MTTEKGTDRVAPDRGQPPHPRGGDERRQRAPRTRRDDDANRPWSLDLSLTGFAGKKRGLTGGVSAAFLF